MLAWPRYQVTPYQTGMAVLDTWRNRRVMSTFGGSRKDRLYSARRAATSAEYNARRRVARIRRVVVGAGVTKSRADRIARELDAAGIGVWGHWFGT